MYRIEFFNLKDQVNLIEKEIIDGIIDVMRSVDFCDGKAVKDFNNMLCGFFKIKYVNCVNSGTSALLLAMRALDIKSGDEVIVPTNSFIASAWAPTYLGATPVFVDCNLYTGNIDTDDILKKITKRTKAIIGVHMYGQPFDIKTVMKICKDNNLYLVEDCAQAFGAKYDNQYVGTFGDIGCFSFYPSKNLGAFGEGGAVITNNINYHNIISKLKNHGSDQKYEHHDIGYNMRMDSFQSKILSIKLKYLDCWNERRRDIARRYDIDIQNKHIIKLINIENTYSVYHLYVVRTKERNKLINYLDQNNISTGIHYPICCHRQKAFKLLYNKYNNFPNAEKFADECVSLPMYPELKDNEVNYIINCINKYKVESVINKIK